MESLLSVETIEKGWLLLDKILLVGNVCVMDDKIPWWRYSTLPVVHTPSHWSATVSSTKEEYTCVTLGWTTCNQFLYVVFECPSKVSVDPGIVITTHQWSRRPHHIILGNSRSDQEDLHASHTFNLPRTVRVCLCLLWIVEARSKDNNYIWISVWWKSKNER